jgi:hypothetical protein
MRMYRMKEQSRTKVSSAPGGKPHWVYDDSFTLEYLLATKAISDYEQTTLGDYMTKVHELDVICTDHIANWPFLAAQRLLKLQLSRLRVIKHALTTRLHGHPLHGDNIAGFNNPDPNADPEPSDLVMYESEAAPAAGNLDLMLFQRGETNGETSQSEIRPGQADPGGWEF